MPFHLVRWFGLTVAVAIFATACGDSTSTSTTQPPPTTAASTTAAPTTAPPTTASPTTAAPTTAAPTTAVATTAAPTTTEALIEGEIIESFVGAETAPYSAERIVEGEVKVYFNNGSNGTLVAIYHGAGLSDPTDLCPGNSLNDGSFTNISNAPASPGASDGIPTDRGSVRICSSDVWLYETRIPNNSVGTLWGSLDMTTDPGIVGMTGQAVNQPDTPEINYDADVFAISAMFTSDGSTKITCGPAMS